MCSVRNASADSSGTIIDRAVALLTDTKRMVCGRITTFTSVGWLMDGDDIDMNIIRTRHCAGCNQI